MNLFENSEIIIIIITKKKLYFYSFTQGRDMRDQSQTLL